MRRYYSIGLLLLILLCSGCPDTVIINSTQLPNKIKPPEFFKKPFPVEDVTKKWEPMISRPSGLTISVVNSFNPPAIIPPTINNFKPGQGEVRRDVTPNVFILSNYNGHSRLDTVLLRTNFTDSTESKVESFKVIVPEHIDRSKIGPTLNNGTEELGCIAPVVLKESLTATMLDETKITYDEYTLWYTKVSMEHNFGPGTPNLISSSYIYTPMSSVSKEPDSIWKDRQDKVSGLEDSEVKNFLKGGVIVNNVMKVGESYILWYLGKKLKNDREVGWELYSTPWNVLERKWNISDFYLTKELDVIGFDKDSIGKGSVYFDPEHSVYKIWYAGRSGKVEKIGLAYSSNGYTGAYKDKDGGIYNGQDDRFDSEKVSDPFVLKDGELYRMWYSGFNGKRWAIGMAYSWDGINFKYVEDSLFSSATEDYRYPCVVKVAEDRYMMWYSKKGADGIWTIEMARNSIPKVY